MNPHYQIVTQVLEAAALTTLGVAAVVLRAHHHVHARERAAAREGQSLALAFARYLTGAEDAEWLRAVAAAARPRVLWAALEAFTDNIEGEEWERLSRALRANPEMRREVDRLGRGSVWRRALAARHLGFLNVPGVRAPLRAALQEGPALVTLTTALALARVHDRAALVWLLAHPEATAGQGRYHLVALLKRFGTGATPELRRALRGRTASEAIHLAAVEVLGLRGDQRSRSLLEGLLAEGSNEARIAAARALGRIGSPRSVGTLVGALGDAAWQVRAQAARALGEIGAEAAVPRLAACVCDESWWVRRHAAYALAEFGPAGTAALNRIARQDADRHAKEMAEEVLQVLEWERESPGNVARVE